MKDDNETINHYLEMASTGQLLDELKDRYPGGLVLVGRAQPNEKHPEGADRVVWYCDDYKCLGLLRWGEDHVLQLLRSRKGTLNKDEQS